MIASVIVFVLFLIFFLVIPTQILLKILNAKITTKSDFLLEVGIIVSLSIVLFTLIGIITKALNISWTVFWILPILSLSYLVNQIKIGKLEIRSININKYILLIIILGVITQSLVLLRGGWRIENGYIFPSLHDNMWSIAISNEFLYQAPQNPAISGEPLKNHHFFYPLFLSLTRFLIHLHIFDLYYLMGPILVYFLFGLGLYSVSSLFTKKNFVRALSVFLGYFSGNFAFILPFFLGKNFDWKGSTFLSDQPFDQIFNPYSVLAFSFLLFGIYSLYRTFENKNKLHFGWGIVASIFIGSLYGFKSFGGIVTILGLFFTFFLWFFQSRKLSILPILILSSVIFVSVFFYLTEPGRVGLFWAPGWILTEMMTGEDKLNLPRFAEIESYYASIYNTLGLLKIKLVEFIIYTIGNLGTRILGFFILLKIMFMPQKYSDGQKLVVLFSSFCVLIAFFIPAFFNLGGNAYNVVQFTPYALVLLSVFTGLLIGNCYLTLVDKNKKLLGMILVLLVLLLSIPVNLKNLLGKIPIQGDIISIEETSALNILKNKTVLGAIILIDPRQFGYDPIYIPALTERRVYLDSPGYARQTGKDASIKIGSLERYFDQDMKREFLLENDITYVYILKPFSYKLLKQYIEKGIYKVYFENEKVLILTV